MMTYNDYYKLYSHYFTGIETEGMTDYEIDNMIEIMYETIATAENERIAIERENNIKNAMYLLNKIDDISKEIELFLVSKADDIGFKIMTDPQYNIDQFSDYHKLIEALKQKGIQ
jgi:CRISPR/Cas system-associated endonuclease Cas3-HD